MDFLWIFIQEKFFDAYKYLGAHVEEKGVTFSYFLHLQPPASL